MTAPENDTPPSSHALGHASGSATGVGSPASVARLEVWKRSLLDLSLRNRLLDLKDGNQLVELAAPTATVLMAAALDETPMPLSTGAAEAASGVARVALADAELDKRLRLMARVARRHRDDGGVQVLWLGLGVLSWRERDSDVVRRAPLVLVPAALERRGVSERYQMVPRADDARINLTLLEKLRAEWGIEMALPAANEAGELDLAAVIAAASTAIAGMSTWRIDDAAALGIFSFAKFVMWTDLQERADALSTAPVVAHVLAGGKGSALPAAGFVEPAHIDALPIASVLTPLDADATQLSAVLAAGAGASFVLQGPPGTGKSQTITNLIAHAMAQGKRVLFVSEKMAALEVVKKRLVQAGLGDFCLELHSSKAQKREVVADLGRVLERAWRPAGPATGDDAKLAQLRGELDAYVAAIHQELPLGLSLHDAVTQITALGNEALPSAGTLPIDTSAMANRDAYAQAGERVTRLAEALRHVAPVAAHPWRESTLARWQPSRSERLQSALAALVASSSSFAELDRLASATMPGIRVTTSGDLAALAALADVAAVAPPVRLEFLLDLGAAGDGGLPTSSTTTTATDDVSRRIADVKERHAAQAHGAASTAMELVGLPSQRPANVGAYVDLASRAADMVAALAARYHEGLWELDIRGLRDAFARYTPRNWLVRWFGLRSAKRQLGRVATQPLGEDGAVLRDLELAHAVVRAKRALGDASADASRWFGQATLGAEQLAAATQHVEWATRLRRGFDAMTALPGVASQSVWRALCASVTSDRVSWQTMASLATAARTSLLGFEEVSGVSLAGEAHPIAEVLAARLPSWQREISRLRDWAAYREVRDEVASYGMEALVEACERDESLVGVALVATWRRRVLIAAVEDGIAKSPALARFYGATHHAKVAEFASYDQASLAVVRARMIAQLAERVPRLGLAATDDGEVGVLLREMKKQRRHKPLRELFREMPHLLGRLKPCLLMSPLSVAQFLDPSAPKFDLVVFDEASQIPASDAIGALARGQAAVVVGDSKQLPPTRFFADQSGATDDGGTGGAEESDYEELESILDECVASAMPQRYLGWHYRSRHEALIEFSNQTYYDGRLEVFPTALAGAPWLGVRLVRVAGVYDRAGTRTNRVEAEAVANAVVAHLRDATTKSKSLAVVTFSQAQQALVEDLLEQARAADASLEPFFAEGAGEPVIVKNLETIQGDERDVVMFSIGYGPDAKGQITMNFGPLNREGGERRLNVAITRAREKLVVFTSLGHEAIRADGAGRGVADLAAFLRFAEARAARALAGDAASNALVAAIGACLVERGYGVRYGIGCSAYRIDVAVIDPDDPTQFVFGVETDGAGYLLAPTARDRDRLRASVLAIMGWRLTRVWAADWFADPERERTRIHTALVNAIAASRAAKKGGKAVTAEPALVVSPAAPTASPAPVDVAAARPFIYQPAVLPRRKREATWIYSGESSFALMELMTMTLATEAPVHIDVMATRIAEAVELPRVTAKFVERIKGLVAGVGQLGVGDEQVFVWAKGGDATVAVVPPRAPSDGPAGRRAVEEICAAEVTGAAQQILAANIGIERAALVKEVAKFFGFTRPNERTLARIDACVARALAVGVARSEGSKVVATDLKTR